MPYGAAYKCFQHCLSVCLSVTMWIVAKRYILQQKCLNKRIESEFTDEEDENSERRTVRRGPDDSATVLVTDVRDDVEVRSPELKLSLPVDDC